MSTVAAVASDDPAATLSVDAVSTVVSSAAVVVSDSDSSVASAAALVT